MGDTILQYVSITKSNCNYGRDVCLQNYIMWNLSSSIFVSSVSLPRSQEIFGLVEISLEESIVILWTAHTVQWFLKEDWSYTQQTGCRGFAFVDNWFISHSFWRIKWSSLYVHFTSVPKSAMVVGWDCSLATLMFHVQDFLYKKIKCFKQHFLCFCIVFSSIKYSPCVSWLISCHTCFW